MLRLLAIPSLLVACSAGDLSETTRETGSPLDTAEPADTDSSLDVTAATWTGLSGNLELQDGAVVLESSSLSWTYFDGDIASICSSTVALASAEVSSTPDPSVLAWWVVTEDPDADTSDCPLRRPNQLELGLGVLDPSLAPAIDASDLDASAAPYGLYARVGWDTLEETTPVWIFGVAGTTGAFDGSAPAVTEGPLPDGMYEMRPLHLFAVP